MSEALHIILTADREFVGIVCLSLLVSLSSTTIATVCGLPLGIIVARHPFRGRDAVITTLNTLMSLPTVLVGLLVYFMLASRGPFGELRLLYSRPAIVIGQSILAFPLIMGLTVGAIRSLDDRIHGTIVSLGADAVQGFRMFVYEARYGILAAVMAGFGRVFTEIGISMMVGGNIKGYTRTITTAIALETSKGEFALAMALGIVLLIVAFMINLLFVYVQRKGK